MNKQVEQAVYMNKVDISETFATKSQLIEAMLPNVVFDGWTLKALDQGSESLGLPKIVGRELFDNEDMNLITHHSRMADQAMIAAMEAQDLDAMKVTEKVRLSLELRLRSQQDNREAIRRASSQLALPQHTALAAKLLYETVDAVWLIAGDTATDYNRYTKRGLLSGVYGSTMLYWLNDTSDDLSDTMAFLDRRLGNVHKVFGSIGKVAKSFGKFKDLLKSPKAEV